MISVKPLSAYLLFLVSVTFSSSLLAVDTSRFSYDYWISPSGSDDAKGSRDEPFKTLHKARDVIRAHRSAGHHKKDYVVKLYGGEYRLDEALVLEPKDSGRPGSELVFKAVAGEYPMIMGSKAVSGWELYDTASGIYRAHVGKVSSRQLYINDARAQRAKTADYPAGFRPTYVDIPIGPKRRDGVPPMLPIKGGIEFVSTDLNASGWKDPSTWKSPSDVEAVIITQWKMMRVPVHSVLAYKPDPIFQPDDERGLIKMQEPAWSNANLYLGGKTKEEPSLWSFWQVTYFENALEFLDTAGEWYLEKSSGYLYYKPTLKQKRHMNTLKAELALRDRLIFGTGKMGDPVSHIRFEGLHFAYTTWMEPSGINGYVADQSGFRVLGNGHKPNITGHEEHVNPTPGNLQFNYGHYIAFVNNKFSHMGAVGLYLATGSQHNRVEGNAFHDIASAAIQLSGVGKPDHHPKKKNRKYQISKHNKIHNNDIHYAGVEYVDAAGIFVGFSEHTEITHNTIMHVPWSGIAMGWGWGLLDYPGFPGVGGAVVGEWGTYKAPTPNRHNKIIGNRIENFLEVVWDGGAIYTTGSQGTSMGNALLIKDNVAAHKRPTGGGNIFYTDGGSRYIKLVNNGQYDNLKGIAYFGPEPNKDDPLPTNRILPLINGLPYGADSGGCRTYGDIVFKDNYVIEPSFYDICPYSQDGVKYPVNLTYEYIPKDILEGAGIVHRDHLVEHSVGHREK